MRSPLLFTILLAGCVAPSSVVEEAAHDPPHAVDVREGTVAGPNLVATSMGPAFEFLHVTPGAARLAIKIAAEGGEALVYGFAPSCDAIECAIRLESDGERAWATDAPEAGEWEFHVAKGDPGVAEVRYTLTFEWTACAS